MKKKVILLIVFLIVFSACEYKDDRKIFQSDAQEVIDKEKKDYEKYVENFRSVDIEEIIKLENDMELFYLFVGFKDCPYCREFVPKLYNAWLEENQDIIYLDTKNIPESRENGSFEEFANKIKLEYVPALYYFNGSEYINYPIDSTKITISDIKEIFKNNK